MLSATIVERGPLETPLGITSSAPVTEYACPFTSFWKVTASESAALVIWGWRISGLPSGSSLHPAGGHRAALHLEGLCRLPGVGRVHCRAGGDTPGWEGTLQGGKGMPQGGWWVRVDTDSMGWPRCIKSPENWFGPAGCTVHTRTVLFPACLWNLLLFYQNFLNTTPILMQVIFVLMNGKKASRRKGLLPQRGLQEVARNPGLELETSCHEPGS